VSLRLGLLLVPVGPLPHATVAPHLRPLNWRLPCPMPPPRPSSPHSAHVLAPLRSNWAAFKGKNKTITKSKNFHDPHWDPTRDHGEVAQRLQIEKYSVFGSRDT